ncbi:MAG: DUF885 domain-containing protein [Acidobacteriota bacterium]
MPEARCLLALSLALLGCGRPKPQDSVLPLAEEFVYSSLAFSPVAATQVGYHQHQGRNLDELLDEITPAALEQQRGFYRDFAQRLAKIQPERLTPQDRADYEILTGQVALVLLDLEKIQSYRHNPTLYVELIGNALFTPYAVEYAPLAKRVDHITARLKQVPGFLERARGMLADSPDIWTTVAVQENQGNTELIDNTIRAKTPEAQRAAYDAAAGPALEALRRFNAFLKDDLSKRPSDWRLGAERFAEKFRHTLGTDLTPDQVLAAAEERLNTVRAQMLERARPLHRQWFPRHPEHPELNVTVSEVLGRIAARHATPESYMPDARRDLQEAREFTGAAGLLALPPRDNLQVIETPEFMRGIYAVGGFMPAPPLEPELGAFYWVTPIPKDWPKARIESKLREYNFFKLKLLTIHEAVPGHYVQFEYAAGVEPKARRLLRSVYGNGPYVEGWAQYATQAVLEAGYLDHSPELRLTFEKEELRVVANAILDIRLHTRGMRDQQALDLMIQETFQETEEATAKLRRAKLSFCQLPTYFVGWRDWLRVRDHCRRAQGAAFQARQFHEQALKQGAVPLPALARLLAGTALGH